MRQRIKIGTKVEATEKFRASFRTRRGLTGTVVDSKLEGMSLKVKRDGLKESPSWFYHEFWRVSRVARRDE